LYCPVIIQTPSLAYFSRLLLVLCPSFPAPLSGLHFCSPDSAYMSTRCTRANSAGKSGQPSTSSLWDSTPQAANAAPSGLAKSQLLQAKFEVPLLDDNGNDNSDDTPHQFSSKRRPRTYVLDAAPAMDDRDLTHSHRSWLRHSSSLANPTKITLGQHPCHQRRPHLHPNARHRAADMRSSPRCSPCSRLIWQLAISLPPSATPLQGLRGA
jgi:hypothetical protein